MRKAKGIAVREGAQEALESLTLSEIREVLATLPHRTDVLTDAQMGTIFDRAEKNRFRDEVLGATVLPAHLYVIDSILQDRGVTGPLLDCLIRAVRTMVYTSPPVASPS